MNSVLREVQQFASASEHLIALASDTSLSEDERALVHYYVREIERTLELAQDVNYSCK